MESYVDNTGLSTMATLLKAFIDKTMSTTKKPYIELTKIGELVSMNKGLSGTGSYYNYSFNVTGSYDGYLIFVITQKKSSPTSFYWWYSYSQISPKIINKYYNTSLSTSSMNISVNECTSSDCSGQINIPGDISNYNTICVCLGVEMSSK